MVQIPHLPPLYNRFINRLVWESTEIELFKMGRICLWLVVMSLFCGVSKVEAQVQNVREKQDSVSVIKLSLDSAEH